MLLIVVKAVDNQTNAWLKRGGHGKERMQCGLKKKLEEDMTQICMSRMERG